MIKKLVIILSTHLLIWLPVLAYAAPLEIKQSTETTIVIGPLISSADFTTVLGTIDVTNISIKLIKADRTVTTISATDSGGTNNMKHITNGMYSLVLSTTDTNTIGASSLIIDPSPESAIPLWENFEIVSATGTVGDLIRILQFKNITNNSVFR